MSSWGAAGRSTAFVATIAIVACSKPDAPTLTPERVEVLGVTPQGLSLQITLKADNPNGFALSARSVKARVVLDGSVDLGEVVVPAKVKLPKRASTSIVVPLQVKWTNLAALGLLAASKPVIPFTMTGTANVGGEGLNLDLPFTLAGSLTREQLLQATAAGLPALPF
jgi:LEA14-like dessication related protein